MHSTDAASDVRWLSQALALAEASVAEDGGPFGALVVRHDEVIATGRNRVTLDLDPSAHAEVMAIRAACRQIGDFTLAGYTLYASCEPCPMCMATALWARLDRVVFAADRHDAARFGFNDREFHDLFAHPERPWPTTVEQTALPESLRPFDAWFEKSDRARY